MTRYIVGFLLAIGLIVVVIILIIRSFTSGPAGPKPLDLNSYASGNVSVQLTVDSPVSASATHRDIIININNNAATLTVNQGYEGETVRSKNYPMNVSAYAVFLHSLTQNGFTKGNSDPSLRDERGQCALGDRYIYEVIDGTGNDMERYWYTSCNSGTFQGDSGAIRQLFEAQIPDYGKLTSDVNL